MTFVRSSDAGNTMTSSNPVALITGASSGIGEAAARRFAKGGWNIVAVARRKERLEQLAKDLAPTQVEVVVADVTADGSPERAVDAAMKKFAAHARHPRARRPRDGSRFASAAVRTEMIQSAPHRHRAVS